MSPLKPLGQMNQNLVGSILGRSSIKNAHFVPISGKIKQKISLFDLDWFCFDETLNRTFHRCHLPNFKDLFNWPITNKTAYGEHIN
jgi:hypothetical protein